MQRPACRGAALVERGPALPRASSTSRSMSLSSWRLKSSKSRSKSVESGLGGACEFFQSLFYHACLLWTAGGRRCGHGGHCSHVHDRSRSHPVAACGPPPSTTYGASSLDQRRLVHSSIRSLYTRCTAVVSKHGDMVTGDGGSSPPPPVAVAPLPPTYGGDQRLRPPHSRCCGDVARARERRQIAWAAQRRMTCLPQGSLAAARVGSSFLKENPRFRRTCSSLPSQSQTTGCHLLWLTIIIIVSLLFIIKINMRVVT